MTRTNFSNARASHGALRDSLHWAKASSPYDGFLSHVMCYSYWMVAMIKGNFGFMCSIAVQCKWTLRVVALLKKGHQSEIANKWIPKLTGLVDWIIICTNLKAGNAKSEWSHSHSLSLSVNKPLLCVVHWEPHVHTTITCTYNTNRKRQEGQSNYTCMTVKRRTRCEKYNKCQE